jgi:PIN domain nuclease of toxin-antitoxin system
MAKADVDEAHLLLDTHALLWWATSSSALGKRVKRLIEDESIGILVSAASAWEIATKVRLGKLAWTAPGSVESYCIKQGFELLSVSFKHAERAGSWPAAHGDPFDRMLAAQSEIENVRLATNDPQIKVFGIKTIW